MTPSTKSPVRAIRFEATLLSPRRSTAKSVPWSFLVLPKGASARLPSRGPTTVEGTFHGRAFRATLQPDGHGGHWLRVERKLREAVGVRPGALVVVAMAPVLEEPEPRVPPDVKRALAAAHANARATWSDITPVARRDWVGWITSGKRAETRRIRIEKACDMLAKGKRRPCCFDRSGMYDRSLACPVAEPLGDVQGPRRVHARPQQGPDCHR